MINFEQKLPFRVHVGQPLETNVGRHIYQFRKQGKGYCPFKLYSPNDRLLPFQIFIPVTEGATLDDYDINDIVFYNCDGTQHSVLSDYPGLENDIEKMQVFGEGIWFIYKGTAPITNMNFPSGYYYFQFQTANSRDIFSELFYVDCNLDYKRLLKIEFWNSCDFSNIIYQTGYKNYFYLDTTLLKGVPSIDETGFENGYGEFQLTSSRYVDNYILDCLVTEYLVHALFLMKSHSEIYITSPETGQIGKFDVKKSNVNWDEGGFYEDISLELEQKQLIYKGSCCENKVFSSILKPLAINDVYKMDLNKHNILEYAYNAAMGVNQSLLQNDIGYLKSIANSSIGTFTTAQNGTIQIFSDGTFKYLKPAFYQGGGSAPFTDTFSYTMKDFYGDTSTAFITLEFDFIHSVADTVLCSGSQVTFNVLTNDFRPISYPFIPAIHHQNLAVVSNKITIYSTNPQTIGNYLEIDLYTGISTYYNVINITSSLIFDSFTYQIFRQIGLLAPPSQILITF